MKITRRLAIVLCLLLAIVGGSAQAGEFMVSPTRFDLNSTREQAEALTFTNHSDREVTVQVSIYEWTQPEGEADQLRPTDEFVFFPRIVELAAGSGGVVRFAYRGPEITDGVDRAFRVKAQEIPAEVAPGTLAFALGLSVPIFVHPQVEHGDPELSWGTPRIRGGTLLVDLINDGSGHARVSDPLLRFEDSQGGELLTAKAVGRPYVLPGASREFGIDLPAEVCRRARVLKVGPSAALLREIPGAALVQDLPPPQLEAKLAPTAAACERPTPADAS